MPELPRGGPGGPDVPEAPEVCVQQPLQFLDALSRVGAGRRDPVAQCLVKFAVAINANATAVGHSSRRF